MSTRALIATQNAFGEYAVVYLHVDERQSLTCRDFNSLELVTLLCSSLVSRRLTVNPTLVSFELPSIDYTAGGICPERVAENVHRCRIAPSFLVCRLQVFWESSRLYAS